MGHRRHPQAAVVLCGSVSAPSRPISQPSQTPLGHWVGGKVIELQPDSGFTGVLTLKKLIKLYTYNLCVSYTSIFYKRIPPMCQGVRMPVPPRLTIFSILQKLI